MEEYNLQVKAGKSHWRGRLSTVDLLVLTSSNQLLLILKLLFTFFTKDATLMRRSTVLSLNPQLIFPGQGFESILAKQGKTFSPQNRVFQIPPLQKRPLTSKKWPTYRRRQVCRQRRFCQSRESRRVSRTKVSAPPRLSSSLSPSSPSSSLALSAPCSPTRSRSPSCTSGSSNRVRFRKATFRCQVKSSQLWYKSSYFLSLILINLSVKRRLKLVFMKLIKS